MVYARGRYGDGSTGDERYGPYGGKPTVRADVGHIFSDKQGGSNTRGNIYMQEAGFNRTIKENHDELNAAMVGYKHTEQAMRESRKHGDLDSGMWKGRSSYSVVDQGKAEWEEVGVRTKKGGGVDKRCRAVKRGEVTVDKYGMQHGLGAKAKEIIDRKKQDDDLLGLMENMKIR